MAKIMNGIVCYEVTCIFIILFIRMTHAANLYEKCTSKSDCPAHGSCSRRGCDGLMCKCDFSYAPNANQNQCLRASRVGHPCDNIVSICSAPLATCNANATCECTNGLVPDMLGETCRYHNVAVLGERCTPSIPCLDPQLQVCGRAAFCWCRKGYRPAAPAEKAAFWKSLPDCIPKSYSLDFCHLTPNMSSIDQSSSSPSLEPSSAWIDQSPATDLSQTIDLTTIIDISPTTMTIDLSLTVDSFTASITEFSDVTTDFGSSTVIFSELSSSKIPISHYAGSIDISSGSFVSLTSTDYDQSALIDDSLITATMDILSSEYSAITFEPSSTDSLVPLSDIDLYITLSEISTGESNMLSSDLLIFVSSTPSQDFSSSIYDSVVLNSVTLYSQDYITISDDVTAIYPSLSTSRSDLSSVWISSVTLNGMNDSSIWDPYSLPALGTSSLVDSSETISTYDNNAVNMDDSSIFVHSADDSTMPGEYTIYPTTYPDNLGLTTLRSDFDTSSHPIGVPSLLIDSIMQAGTDQFTDLSGVSQTSTANSLVQTGPVILSIDSDMTISQSASFDSSTPSADISTSIYDSVMLHIATTHSLDYNTFSDDSTPLYLSLDTLESQISSTNTPVGTQVTESLLMTESTSDWIDDILMSSPDISSELTTVGVLSSLALNTTSPSVSSMGDSYSYNATPFVLAGSSETIWTHITDSVDGSSMFVQSTDVSTITSGSAITLDNSDLTSQSLDLSSPLSDSSVIDPLIDYTATKDLSMTPSALDSTTHDMSNRLSRSTIELLTDSNTVIDISVSGITQVHVTINQSPAVTPHHSVMSSQISPSQYPPPRPRSGSAEASSTPSLLTILLACLGAVALLILLILLIATRRLSKRQKKSEEKLTRLDFELPRPLFKDPMMFRQDISWTVAQMEHASARNPFTYTPLSDAANSGV